MWLRRRLKGGERRRARVCDPDDDGGAFSFSLFDRRRKKSKWRCKEEEKRKCGSHISCFFWQKVLFFLPLPSSPLIHKKMSCMDKKSPVPRCTDDAERAFICSPLPPSIWELLIRPMRATLWKWEREERCRPETRQGKNRADARETIGFVNVASLFLWWAGDVQTNNLLLHTGTSHQKSAFFFSPIDFFPVCVYAQTRGPLARAVVVVGVVFLPSSIRREREGGGGGEVNGAHPAIRS